MSRLISLVSSAAIAALLTAGCAGPDTADQTATDGNSPTPNSSAPTPQGPTSVGLPVDEGADVHGLVTVNGHDLAVHRRDRQSDRGHPARLDRPAGHHLL